MERGWLVFGGLAALAAVAAPFVLEPPSDVRADARDEPRGVKHETAPPSPPVPFLQPRREEPAATRAAERVLATLERVKSNLIETRYQHRTVVRERRGKYFWDCSGMADWILRRAAPRAQRALNRERPVARTFFRTIDRAPTDRQRRGWQQVAHIEDARPGDLFAWLRPPDWPRRNTGHVGFVIEAPRRVNRWPGAYVVRIADATSVPHDEDTRSYPGEGGYGEGTILWMTDGAGSALSYGWFGARSRGVVETRAVFGRVHR